MQVERVSPIDCALAAIAREAEGDPEMRELLEVITTHDGCPACIVKALAHFDRLYRSRGCQMLMAAYVRQLAGRFQFDPKALD